MVTEKRTIQIHLVVHLIRVTICVSTMTAGENSLLSGANGHKKEDAGDYLMPVHFSAQLPGSPAFGFAKERPIKTLVHEESVRGLYAKNVGRPGIAGGHKGCPLVLWYKAQHSIVDGR
jgi:hypothetical protein